MRFEAGMDLFQRWPELARQTLLVREGELSLQGVTCRSVELSAGTLMYPLSELSPVASNAKLLAQGSGLLFSLTRSQFDQLHEQTQLVLLQRGRAFSSRLATGLIEERDALRQSCGQLAANAFKELRAQSAGLERSEGVLAVIDRIPRLPVSCIELLERLLDENSTHAQVVDMVRQDPAMTATLLKAVNSPAYSFGNPVADLSHAVTMLGFEGVYQIIMAETLRRSLPDSEGFKVSYQRALMLSYIAFALAQVTGRGRPAELATIALLHDIGRVVLVVMQRQQPACRELVRRVPSGVAGSLLLRNWLLPEVIWQVISLQHYPQWMPPEQLPSAWCDTVALLHLAGWVMDDRLKQVVAAPFVDAYQHQLGLEAVSAEQLWQQKIVPQLRQRRNALPAALRRMLG
ncbi:hypothetical protein GCM10009104_35270 [Marinobacterium maritimum]|uniref:HDOD domain-containing protein n=1 Tax=Marinobacterium maritimum TaxID=500162 RepID=A0ABP3TH89_9GAMM